MIRKTAFSAFLTIAVTIMACGNASAQWSQRTACPGWNNPESFSTGSNVYRYTGAAADAGSKGLPQVSTCTTNPNWSGITWPSSGSNVYSAGQIASQQSSCSAFGSSYYSARLPEPNKLFRIMDTNDIATGCPKNRDPYTKGTDGVYHLPFVPNREFNTYDTTGRIINTMLSSSIRVGDDCPGNGTGSATALYYYLQPNSQNALLFIYYAVVVSAPTHSASENPAFVIGIEHKNSANQWVALSDTLVYAITVESNMPVNANYNENGWHDNNVVGQSSYYGAKFKDWTKVVINLSNHLYENLRIHISISDCEFHAHPAWAYIAGECREMSLKDEGCPAGLRTDVATIMAPRGMQRYQWAASEYGVSDPVDRLEAGAEDDYFSFRTLTMPEGNLAAGRTAEGPEDTVFVSGSRRDTVRFCDYHVKADDFRILYRPNPNKVRNISARNAATGEDSVGNRQTFRCRMTSAIDPSKPFTSDLYINIQNTKPSMKIDTLSMCDGTVRLWNQSYVPGAPNLVVDSTTKWSFYSHLGTDGLPFGDPDTVFTGDSIDYLAANSDERYVLVRTNTPDTGCYSEAIYAIHPLESPKTAMTIAPKVLCDSASTVLTDVTPGEIHHRTWRYLKADYNGPLDGLDYSTMQGSVETVSGYLNDNASISRSFTHSIEPIELTVWNGKYYLNRTDQTDTIWCSATARDTVAVFVHPNLEVTGDTIVCEGSYTDATVRTIGVDGCSYEWSLTPGVVTGNIPAGDHLRVVPYADTSVYYVKVTSPQGCEAWGSVNAYYVQPKLEMFPPDGLICPGDTVMLVGSMADHYSWKAGSSNIGTGDTLFVTPRSTTVYTMVGHGSNDCDATPLTEKVTVVPYPTPKVQLSPKYVDSDDPTVVLTNASPNATSTSWIFDGGETSEEVSVKHVFEEAYAGQDSVVNVVLTTSNRLGCTVVHPFTIPVHLFTAWLPTVFTPGSEDVNAKFKLFTINEYEYFHIYIYNREGMLVFESEDPAFEWDGTHNGTPCPQGAYVYVCNYRKPHTGTLSNRKGTITLLR